MFKYGKKLSLIFSIFFIFSFSLVCCDNNNNNANETVKLTWYVIGDEPSDNELVEKEVNKYIKEKINATVDIKHISFGDYTQKMNVLSNSGGDYDLAFTSSWAFPYLENARKGAFLELNDLLNTEGKDLKKEINKELWKGAEIDGKIYAVPNQKEIAAAPVWVFDKQLVEKYNIPYQKIHSINDLEPWLKLIKEKEPDFIPFYTQGDSIPLEFDDIINPLGIFYNDKSLTVKNKFESQEMKNLLMKLREYYEKGYINQDAAVSVMKPEIKRFVWKADWQPFAENGWGKSLGREVVTSSIIPPYVTNNSATGAMTAISSSCKHPKKAMELLNLVNTDVKLRNLLMFGIEGKHYEKVDENQIKKLPGKKYEAVSWAYGNLLDTYTLQGDPKNKWNKFKEFNDSAKISPILGFKFNTEKVANQISAINNVLQEFEKSLYTGSIDPISGLEDLNKKLKASGIDEVKKEMQSQLDAWKKNNQN